MKTKDLIQQLQELVNKHELYVDVMGEHEIMIDVFQKDTKDTFQYKGITGNIIIEHTSDGAYTVLSYKEGW